MPRGPAARIAPERGSTLNRFVLATGIVVVFLAAPRSSDAALSLALPHGDYPRHAQIVVLKPTNAEADHYFGPVHRSPFERLHRIDGAGWMQAGLWHFATGVGGMARQHTVVFAYGIHVFKGKSGARKALLDVKLRTHPSRVVKLYALRYRHSDAQETLVFAFFTFHEVLVEAYYEYHGAAPASTARAMHKAFSKQTSHLASVARQLVRAIHTPPTPVPTATATATATASPTETATPAPTSTLMSVPTVQPSATPIPSPTAFVSPTPATTATSASLMIEAHPTSPTFAPGSNATVEAHVSIGGQPVVGASVAMSFSVPGQPSYCATKTDPKGGATCSIVIPDDVPSGTRIDVTVTVEGSDGAASTSTSFRVMP